MDIYNKLLNKETKLSVIGLGYVGLPIALEFARKIDVIGFDIKADRVEMMKNKKAFTLVELIVVITILAIL